MTLEITDKTMQENIDKNGVLVLDFYASWCMPCKMMTPAFDELAEEMSGVAVFAKIDIDENPETAKKYGVTSIPSIIILKDGKLEEKMVGLQQKMKIEDTVSNIVKKEN